MGHIKDNLVSRRHCVLELDAERGAVYVIDTSTNGTYLNSELLPSKSSAKILVSHGDDLVLKQKEHDPNREFGWIVNVTELAIKQEVTYTGPRRIVRIQDMQNLGSSLNV